MLGATPLGKTSFTLVGPNEVLLSAASAVSGARATLVVTAVASRVAVTIGVAVNFAFEAGVYVTVTLPVVIGRLVGVGVWAKATLCIDAITVAKKPTLIHKARCKVDLIFTTDLPLTKITFLS